MTQTVKKNAEQVVAKSPIFVVATIDDMVDRFIALKTTTFIQLWQTTETISRMRKTGNRFFGKVKKVNCLNAVTNYNYESMVNRARSKESMERLRREMVAAGVTDDKIELFFKGAKKDITENAETFQSSGLPFGEYKNGSRCIIVDTPKSKKDGGKSPWAGIEGYYIQVAVIHSATPVYRWIENGEELSADEVAEMKTFITPKKEGEKQGLEKPYIIRAPRFETIDSVSMNKVNYVIVG